MKKENLLYRITQRAVFVCACVFTALLLLMNFVYNAEVAYSKTELVTIYHYIPQSVFILFMIFVLLFLCRFARKLFAQVDAKRLFIAFGIVYTAMAAYLIITIGPAIRADARSVMNAAVNLLNGDLSYLDRGGYIYRYPHQLGLMLYDLIPAALGGSPVICFIMNFGFVLGINYLTYKISDHLFKDERINTVTVILSFAFLPQLFFIIFAYGLIPGFFFMMLAFYNALKFVDGYKTKNLVGAVLASGAALIFKKNFMIGAVAVILYLVLRLMMDKKLKSVVAIALVALSLVLPMKIIIGSFELFADKKLDQGAPTVLWLAMGTDIDNNVRGPGWYNSYNYRTYDMAGYDAAAASEAGSKKLSENMDKIKNEPARAFEFFRDKNVSQWCEPMYQSVWSGPLEDCGQTTDTALTQSIYTGGRAEDMIASVSKFVTVALWFFALVYLVVCAKGHSGWELMYMFFMGGFIFHTVWEGKSQYIYPYVFCLIPFAACAIRRCITAFSNIDFKKRA